MAHSNNLGALRAGVWCYSVESDCAANMAVVNAAVENQDWVEFMGSRSCEYGVGDNSYRMAGELPGITKLVHEFYNNMDSFSASEKIRDMHTKDLTISRKKLAYFLSGWLGGPKLYAEHYGGINIPLAHKHLTVGVDERDAWLLCMQKAVDDQPYETAFKTYLMEQLSVPAERIRVVSGNAVHE